MGAAPCFLNLCGQIGGYGRRYRHNCSTQRARATATPPATATQLAKGTLAHQLSVVAVRLLAARIIVAAYALPLAMIKSRLRLAK